MPKEHLPPTRSQKTKLTKRRTLVLGAMTLANKGKSVSLRLDFTPGIHSSILKAFNGDVGSWIKLQKNIATALTSYSQQKKKRENLAKKN